MLKSSDEWNEPESVETVILSIIGGTIVAASPSTTYNEDAESTVRLDKGDNPEHSLHVGKPLDEVTALKEPLESATLVVDTEPKRYYIFKPRDSEVVMAATNLADDSYQVLKALLTGDDPDNAYRTFEKALDDTKGEREIVHDDRNGVDC